jgi:serine/threonine-protein kinase
MPDAHGAGADSNASPQQNTLAALIHQRGPLPQSELLTVFVQVLLDLEFAHGQGMLHRDITSARIVREGKTYKLADYGTSSVGTVRYMSPERCQGKPLDGRSDIYSAGAALYEAATGRLPFDGELNYQIIDAQLNRPPPPPRSIRPELSAELDRVILRALTKNPAGRFQTAADFRRALEALSGSLATRVGVSAAEPVGEAEEAAEALEPRARRTGRVSLRILAVAGLLIILAAAGYVALKTGIITTGAKLPSVVGMTKVEALKAAAERRLALVLQDVDDTSAAGRVVSQFPPAGARSSRGDTIRASVSTGLVDVPVLAGFGLAEAQAALKRAALALVKVDSQYSDVYAPGTVMAVGPKAGSRLRPRAEVTLTVANGRATCPACGAEREPGANFCVKCGHKF